ncbi:LYR motif-containing protein 9 [Clonorchis sinensis]|uniref:LYR motif-containing protein 9 n=1 Tax=Clonorchis sinensis TaxID=79923 RepID=A0A8T1MG57_CLOSI|nr:LYR motif-containing protein 9 [Clonorchis sinensis]
MTLKPSTPVQLYRHLLRRIRSLPQPVQEHYRHHQFNSHSDEEDPVRIAQLITKATEDMEWLVKKYSK